MEFSKDTVQSLKNKMKSPIGTTAFEFYHPDLTNKLVNGFTIFEIVSGKHVFVLERTNNLKINFYYSSPGSGTSVAAIDLTVLPQFNKAFFCFTWSPKKISLSIGPREIDNAKLIYAEGIESPKNIAVGNDESIYFIGDENSFLMTDSIFEAGKENLSSNALETWNNVKKAIEILGTGKSEHGYLYECVLTNLSLSSMVTGFESYLKKRFLELENEGMKPNIEDLMNYFLSSKEKQIGTYEILMVNAKNENISALSYIVHKRLINFQNFDNFKKAYKLAYGLTLDFANIDSRLIVPIKKFLIYRHKIIHVSPLIGILNQAEVPSDKPIFSNESLKFEAIDIFDEFIQLFHKATIELKIGK